MEGWDLEVMGRVDGWDVLGKAVWAETEPRSVAEPYIDQSSDKIWHLCSSLLPWELRRDQMSLPFPGHIHVASLIGRVRLEVGRHPTQQEGTFGQIDQHFSLGSPPGLSLILELRSESRERDRDRVGPSFRH